ncbi:helix-turn-helix transcriptional regulator [Chryseobacterium sp.]|uniref:helix-turn-helix domain-containing protein n=1 Tax=Chryseobacterium sp. TaxID=1871047 RepID=UPI0025C20B10|nr:helix-turn-helix transcriptional regulator [Chryseobacterium sp.]MBV8326693.1 helix-turn-helix transcriptional regulator [Chryseobacterium sp.]
MEKKITFEITQFDFDLINHIRNLRESAGFTKEELSLKMGLAKSFVGNVESYTQRHKYSTRHIAMLARAFGYKNISDLMKFPTPKYDMVKVTVKQTLNENNTKVIKSEIFKINPI